jgi:hypothetical protein
VREENLIIGAPITRGPHWGTSDVDRSGGGRILRREGTMYVWVRWNDRSESRHRCGGDPAQYSLSYPANDSSSDDSDDSDSGDDDAVTPSAVSSADSANMSGLERTMTMPRVAPGACRLCGRGTASHIAAPCGHVAYCGACAEGAWAEKGGACAVCSKDVVFLVRLYL